MSEYKTNYFGSFLDAVRTPASVSATSSRATPAPPPGPAGGTADNVLKLLDSLGGAATMRELLPAAGNSIDGLLAAVNALHTMEFATTDGSKVAITEAGAAQAPKLP